ncbi:hybrid sensor histidine kinase/response regulator [Mucilaginibacter limnophilus]|uniref:histidine kinase n=1 Tax=Mucilaginibacter limnophilus TaxID=1932778 RepID=A0A437MZA0_9SPHI|nr:two-component regulator propeller domain-containing protein [Mucilaginibacter limnophilus]RVU02992.1 hybrid sensor histidine kinase/response regulator [Mucilaginibacter limnophilus]
MRYVLKLLLSCVFLLHTGSTLAQVNYVAVQIDNASGLSNSCINSVFQDSDDLIWLATWDGLNLYNGTSMHVFNYGKEKSSSFLSSNVIYNISEDLERNIWVGTVEGVSKLNKQTGVISNYFYDSRRVNTNGFVVAVTSKGQVFAINRNKSQLFRYEKSTDKFITVKLNGLGDKLIYNVQFDGKDNLWLQDNGGILELYQPQNNGYVKRCTIQAGVNNLFYVNNTLFFSTNNNVLYKAAYNAQPVKLLQHLPHEVRSMAYYEGHYILAWSSKGIGEYNIDFKPELFISKENPMLAGIRITSLCAGKENILWLGSDGNGAIRVTKKLNYFNAVGKQPNSELFRIPVRAFCKVNNQLWVGTKGNGITTIKNLGSPVMSFSSIRSFNTGQDLLDNCVYTIQKDNNGTVYIGSDAPGITLYDESTKKIINWNQIQGSNKYPPFGSVHCILNDKDGSIWLGLNDNGLVHLKLKKVGNKQYNIEYLRQYVYNDAQTGPASNVIYTLAQGSGNYIWVGCRYGGLSLFNKSTGKFTTYKAFTYKGSLSNNDVLSLYIDGSRRLWVGTSFGLNWIDEAEAVKNNKPVFKFLNTDNGLPNNSIHAITEDDKNNIWISTNKGLAKIDPNTLKIVSFKEADGLQNDEFSDNAVWRSVEGQLFFGGIYGFNYFDPQNIKINTRQPQLMLSNLQLANKKDDAGCFKVLNAVSNPTSVHHYNLMPQDNFFEQKVEFISFITPQKCRYSYFLEGNDKDWHQARHNQTIFYNNLSPGDYKLKIKWSNGEGGWTAPVTAYTITVKQYFWLTPLAFCCYAIVLAGSGYLFYRYRRNKFLLKQQIRVEHMLREKDEKLHQQQLNFFTNIAHELQTPLTLILGSMERYFYRNNHKQASTGNSRFLSVVNQEAARLHYLIQQLLEFRKAESGHLKNHYSYLHVTDLLKNIAALFDAVSEQKNIDLSVHIEPEIHLWTDKDKLEKIIYNLLSNAFKHSGQNEYVMFSVNRLPAEEKLEIIVANSGCGLSNEQVNKVFDMFFTDDDTQQTKLSSGIGLAFTRQMVLMLNGDISVNCQNNWISFKVTLPLQFIPEGVNRQAQPDKPETLSYIFSSLTQMVMPLQQQATMAENNKLSLVNSYDRQKKHVLIVEDETTIRYLLRDILADKYLVYEASTGYEALDVIKRTGIDLIISDIMMPDMDGLELCRVIKETPESCHLPVILLSARSSIDQQTEGYGLGADAYIPKPFKTEHLLVRVQALLEYRDKIKKLFKNDHVQLPAATVEANDQDKKFIKTVINLIEQHIEEDIDGSFLENALNVSKMQLYRKIKTFSEMTPTELIRHVRLKRAAHLLEVTNLTVSEIFYKTGFNNKTYFFREFKKLYHCSPVEYRQKFQLQDIRKKSE